MSKYFNLYLLEYAIEALLRQKRRNLFIMIIYTLLVFLLSGAIFIAHSLRDEMVRNVDALPEIIVENTKGGRHTDIDTRYAERFLQIPGVASAVPRVWGYYYFQKARVYFSLVGVDMFEEPYTKTLQQITQRFDFDDDPNIMIIGKGVAATLKKSYYNDGFNFLTPQKEVLHLKIGGIFDDATLLESNDLVFVSQINARKILGIAQDKASDIALKIPNENEIATVASKIRLLLPQAKVITKESLKTAYKEMFDFKSGIFLALFSIALFTFFMIVYERLSGVTSEEKKEVGILKALGWRVDDILKEKFYEAAVVSLMSFLLGIGGALVYVYVLQAPLLRNVFIGYDGLKPPLEIPFTLDTQSVALLFFATVPVYIAATLFPAWRLATQDADEVMR